jgi:hypothetical protein
MKIRIMEDEKWMALYLFIVDKFAGASHLVDEMTIIE